MGVLLEEADGEAAEEREVGGSVAVSELVVVFAELNVQDPVQAVLHGPVAARGTAQGLGMERMVADEGPLLPVFLEVLVADVLPVTDDDNHRVQLRPLRLQCEVFRELQDVRRARFDATVGGLVLDETFVLPSGEVAGEGCAKDLLQGLVQRRLVTLHREHVMGFFLDDLCGNVLLAAGRVVGDRAARSTAGSR